MGHNINAFIAKEYVIQRISEHWIHAEKYNLPQGYALSLLNDNLLDDIEELFNKEDTCKYPQFQFLTDSVISFFAQESKGTEIIYIETDYFGGYGTQSGILFENGQMMSKPMQGEGTINFLLHKIGVYRENNKDEFDSLQLFRFRHMDYGENIDLIK
ncbi:MAG: hypothetical protein IJ666_08625 [Ruminococcus sp.]|nr:hypothetical protein [Ruminococcus sp.]